jgi:hypothetical protein
VSMALASELGQIDEAPPDAELLADAVEALEAGRLPPEFALEEVVHVLRGVPRVAAELRRREGCRMVARVQAANPCASMRAVAAIVGRRLGVSPETVRGWARAGVSTHELGEAGTLSRPGKDP